MQLAHVFPRHELPKLARAAAAPDGLSTVQVAAHVIAAKGLAKDDRHLRKAIGYKLVQLLRQWKKKKKVERVGKVGTVVVWQTKTSSEVLHP